MIWNIQRVAFSISCLHFFASLNVGSNCEIPLNNCSYSPCRNGATCKAITRTQFECNCPARYTGSLCESYMELCLSRPCLNGGTCSENLEDNEYDCLCPFGYFGKVCQNNRDFCVGHDCKNGATCVDGTREYTCTCPLGKIIVIICKYLIKKFSVNNLFVFLSLLKCWWLSPLPVFHFTLEKHKPVCWLDIILVIAVYQDTKADYDKKDLLK